MPFHFFRIAAVFVTGQAIVLLSEYFTYRMGYLRWRARILAAGIILGQSPFAGTADQILVNHVVVKCKDSAAVGIKAVVGHNLWSGLGHGSTLRSSDCR